MKKGLSGFFALLLAVVLLASIAQPVSAIKIDEPEAPPPAAGEWEWYDESVTGTVVPQYTLPADAEEWLTLMTNGLHISRGTLICHPFRGGSMGWTADIRLWSGGKWLPVFTTTQWMPDEEGRLMTCTNAPWSGVYAVFGYWQTYEGYMEESPVIPVFDDILLEQQPA